MQNKAELDCIDRHVEEMDTLRFMDDFSVQAERHACLCMLGDTGAGRGLSATDGAWVVDLSGVYSVLCLHECF